MSALLALLLSLVTLVAPASALRPLDPAAGVVEVLQMPVATAQQGCVKQLNGYGKIAALALDFGFPCARQNV